MLPSAIPSLLTPGRIAAELGAPLGRVLYILSTRRHISPSARAGTLRLYDRRAVAMVRHELNTIDARRGGRGVDYASDALEPALLTIREAAKLLNCGERSLWRWSRSGVAPVPLTIGGVKRFDRQGLLDWIQAGCPRVDERPQS